MSRAWRGHSAAAAAPLALAVLLLVGDVASAAAAGADPASTAATQIGQSQSPRPDVAADQVTGGGQTPGIAQLPASPGHPTAPTQITHPAAGRSTGVVRIEGHDRCDPASPESKSADCASIPENRAADFQSDETDATTNTVDPNTTSQDLVNGILSSGTGTVVQLPPK